MKNLVDHLWSDHNIGDFYFKIHPLGVKQMFWDISPSGKTYTPKLFHVEYWLTHVVQNICDFILLKLFSGSFVDMK